MTTATAQGPDIQIGSRAREILLGAIAREAGAPYVRIHVGRG